MKFEIADKRLLKGGIMQMFPLAKNICAIRMGYNLVDENRIDHLMKKEAAEEYIGIISVSQFISDMILKLPVFTMEYIDEVYYDMTLSDISKQGKYLIYSRINTDDYSQEIIFYEYVKKDTLMVVNKNPYNRDLIMPCVLNKRPYLIRKKKNHREFYYIKKNNVMLKLPSENEIVDLLNDFIVIKSHKRPLFKKPESYLDVYRYDDMTRVYREKTDCTPQCLINGGDDLLIFVEGK